MAERVTLSRTKGWKMPPDTVKVSRPSIWGNPFKVGEASGHSFNDGGDPTPMIAALTREQCVEMYRDMLRGFLSPEMHPHGHNWMRRFREKMHLGYCLPSDMARSYLRGKHLACFCKPSEPCHADVLLQIANPKAP